MDSMNNTEVWAFLSHSNEDYEKVRLIRDILEENHIRPIMFFLKCLDDKSEIDSLIEREIKARTRFVLCDSENARKSNWVQREVEIIKSLKRPYEVVNLDAPIFKIRTALMNFKRRSSVYISYSAKSSNLSSALSDQLREYNFLVNRWEELECALDHISKQEKLNRQIEETCKNGYFLMLIDGNDGMYKAEELRVASKINSFVIPVLINGSIDEALLCDSEILDLRDYHTLGKQSRKIVEYLLAVDIQKNR